MNLKEMLVVLAVSAGLFLCLWGFIFAFFILFG